jgi:hypothetical protein
MVGTWLNNDWAQNNRVGGAITQNADDRVLLVAFYYDGT